MDKILVARYRKKEWKDFRKRILEKVGYVCCKCGMKKDEKELQLHHIQYIKGRMPWEYSENEVIILCKGCHLEEHGKIYPRSGWVYMGEDDLGDLSGTCEHCGHDIRYEHTVYHPEWGNLIVGCGCADKLTGTTDASEMQLYEEKIEKFIQSTKWKRYKNLYVFNKLVSPQNVEYKIKIWDNVTRFNIQVECKQIDFYSKDFNAKNNYLTLNEAKRKIYEVIVNHELDNFLIRQNIIERLYNQNFISKKLVEKYSEKKYENPLYQYLMRMKIDKTTIDMVFDDYGVGSTCDGGIIFWQIDEKYHIHRGQIIWYDSDCKFIKQKKSVKDYFHIDFGKDKYEPAMCYFGQHLVAKYPQKKIRFVKNEITALVAACYRPDFNWIAMIDVKKFRNYRLNFVKECNLIVYSESCDSKEWEEHASNIEILRGVRIKVIENSIIP